MTRPDNEHIHFLIMQAQAVAKARQLHKTLAERLASEPTPLPVHVSERLSDEDCIYVFFDQATAESRFDRIQVSESPELDMRLPGIFGSRDPPPGSFEVMLCKGQEYVYGESIAGFHRHSAEKIVTSIDDLISLLRTLASFLQTKQEN